MDIKERIYKARARWNASFELISFILDMNKEEVMEIYHKESANRKKKTPFVPEANIGDCLVMTERSKNILIRHGIRTIGQLVALKSYEDVAWHGVGDVTALEILKAASRARKEMDAR